MADTQPAGDLRFLFRTDEGTISKQTWWRGVAMLAAPLVVLTIVWRLLEPYANRGLDERQFVDPMTLVTFVYVLLYAFAILLIAVCYVNLSIKRLRARSLPTGLAGLLPLAALVTGAAHWLQPRVAEAMPWAIVIALDVVLTAITAWTIFELGARERA